MNANLQYFEPHISRPHFLDFLGLSDPFVNAIKKLLGYFTVLNVLTWTNVLITVALVILALAMVSFIFYIFSYSKENYGWIKKIKLVPELLTKDSLSYFQEHCQRNPDGTYNCSYAHHKSAHALTRFSFKASLASLLIKVGVTILIIGIHGGYIQAFSGRQGTNYNIFIDSYSGGGRVSSNNFTMDSSFDESFSSSGSTSNNFSQNAGFTSIGNEPSIGLSITSAPILNLGALSTTSTASSSHTFEAFYNGDQGYDIYLESNPPTEVESGYTIAPIGHVPQYVQPGVEQFGINLRGNTDPEGLGADVSGGTGHPTAAYNNENQYAFQRGDIISQSSTRSQVTTFTTSIILDISPTTPAGAYVGQMTYVMVPRY